MNIRLSERMRKADFQTLFTAEILKAAADSNIISFAGGLPNPLSFPVKDIEMAAQAVLQRDGAKALQYSSAQGFPELREHISKRYKSKLNLDISADEIIITNGSQQALDIFSAVLLDPNDEIIVENPSYLAALQTFHLYKPIVLTVELMEDGMDTDALEALLETHNPKFVYVIPNFQNPTGLTYSIEKRKKVASLLKGRDIFVLEDNPYSELRFTGSQFPSLGTYLGEQCCLLGTFSKVVAPGMRIGWIACKNKELFQKLLDYKTTMDLHTNIFCQLVISEYLDQCDFDAHIEKTKELYKNKALKMMECLDKYLPDSVTYTKPEGGMFIWAKLPDDVKGVDVQELAMTKGVAVCAGDPFFEYERGVPALRINYSNSSDEAIEKGIKILGETIRELL